MQATQATPQQTSFAGSSIKYCGVDSHIFTKKQPTLTPDSASIVRVDVRQVWQYLASGDYLSEM